jgi:death-on-curing family protein
MKTISLAEVEYVSCDLAKKHMAWNEPIPDFGTRFPGKLESCLAAPFQTYGRKQLYRGLVPKAAVLFYLLVKNHPFQNGNKRIAVTTLLYFFYKNGKWLKVSNIELYNFAKWVASSNPVLKQATINAVEDFLNLYLVKKK